MKIAIVGLEFRAGKAALKDPRLDTVQKLTKCPTKTPIQVELVGENALGEADGIVCTEDKKLDLIVHDLEIIEKRLTQAPSAHCEEVKAALEKSSLLASAGLSPDALKAIADTNLVTIKPVFIVPEGASVDAVLFAAYTAFGSASFFTGAGTKDARAWSIKQGASAYEAAGKIHSDIQKGFIRAEVIHYDDFVKAGGIHEAQNQNLKSSQGKEYSVQDGDWITFQFAK
jgi:ribosome-binding ATPase YchF (GTP1/OBG family)